MYTEVEKMSNKCPKCGAKLSPLYLKPACPKCGVNFMQYGFDERLAADKENAEKEWTRAENTLLMLKNSTVKTPWHIVRLVLFFTPLLSMCLPLFWAGHKSVSLISLIMSIINHGLDLQAMVGDKSYLFAVLTLLCVILFSLGEIICSLFTARKNGYKRNLIAFSLNFAALALTAFLAIGFGAKAKIGLTVTFLIYLAKLILHTKVAEKGLKGYSLAALAVIVGATIASGCFLYHAKAVTYSVPEAAAGDVSVVSFNVASAFGSKFDDTDSMTRADRFAGYMNGVKPDLIGTQEMNSYWLTALQTGLADYESYGVQRGGDSEEKNSEMNAVFWNKSKFSLLEKNTFWLSETPEKESKYTYTDENGQACEAGCNRICTYVVLQNRQTKETLVFLNTHLDNASQQAADFGAGVILQKIEALKAKYGKDVPMVLTGDFNETREGDAYRLVAGALNDCTDDTKQTATYQEWGYCNTGDAPIDFIFTSGTGRNYTVLNNLSGGYISDHYGIYSSIDF